MVSPSIQFKTVEADALNANRNFGEIGANVGVEAIAIHSEIGRRVAEPHDAGEEGLPARETAHLTL